MVASIIHSGRADVVIREDVIESTSDPKPNSFFDSKTGILRVYHGPKYGNSSASLLPAKAEQIGSTISQLNESASVCCSKCSCNLVKKNNDTIPSAGTDTKKKQTASSINKSRCSSSGSNNSPLTFSPQRSLLPNLNVEIQDEKHIREGLRTSSITTPLTIIDDPGNAYEISKESFFSKEDDEHNEHNEIINLKYLYEKSQSRPNNTDRISDEREKYCEDPSMQANEIIDPVILNKSDNEYINLNTSKSRRKKKDKMRF